MNQEWQEIKGLTPVDLGPVLDSIGDAIFIDDARGFALWINRACMELYQITRAEIVGKHCSYLEKLGIFSPSVARQVMEKGEKVSILHQNRSGKRLLTTGTPIFDGAGELSLIITTSHDITELVELENRLENMETVIQDLRTHEGMVYGSLIAGSPAMYHVVQLAERLAAVDTTILISGESGSGKGVVARLIHDLGKRANEPFVTINCGAIPDNLLESELFGYEPGAFTGSRREGKRGLFETAQGGTLFLDEISELPLNLQVKLLQVIQEKKIQRVGGLADIAVDVKIVSATNKDLAAMVKTREFREDLFYRLNVVPLHIPPLRERLEDIVPMIRVFLQKSNHQFGEKKIIDVRAISLLQKYDWPGNVRELENLIERLVVTTRDSVIRPDHLPAYIRERAETLQAARGTAESTLSFGFGQGEAFQAEAPGSPGTLKEQLAQAEKRLYEAAAGQYRTTREIARALGVSQPTAVRKLRHYQIGDRTGRV